MRTLIDSLSAYDAGVMGYDAPCSPWEDGQGLFLRAQDDTVILNGPDGEITLIGEGAIRCVIQALEKALSIRAQKTRQLQLQINAIKRSEAA